MASMRTPHELFDDDLPAACLRAPCSLLVCDLLSWKEIGDRYGHTATDLAVDGLRAIVSKVLPRGAIAAHIRLTKYVILVHGDLTVGERLAHKIIREAASRPIVVSAPESVVLRIAVGVASSDDGAVPARMAFDATWRAIGIAPHLPTLVASSG
jgi:GGDEF domain-containing protein